MKQILNGTIDTQSFIYKPIGTINLNDDVTLELEFTMNGERIDFVNPSFKVLYQKEDDNVVEQEDEIVYENGKVIIAVKNQAVSYPGIVATQIRLNDDGKISTSIFNFHVQETIEGVVVNSSSDIKTLDEVKQYLDKAYQDLDKYTESMEILKAEDLKLTKNEEERLDSEKSRENKEKIRIEKERIRTLNELSREESEKERLTKEIERNETEEDRIENENNRKIAENNRKIAESGRIAAEESRQALFEENENIRNKQEKKRVISESDRNDKMKLWEIKESNREENEQSRVNREQNREDAESIRREAEKVRELQEENRENTYNNFNLAESQRGYNEEIRKDAEEKRVAAEVKREESYELNEENRNLLHNNAEKNRNNLYNQAESLRNTAFKEEEDLRRLDEGIRGENELFRIKKEEERSNKELERIDNEKIRTAAETKRVQDEAIRVENEKGRVAAEIEREKTLNDHIENHPSGVTPEQEKEIAKIPEIESQLKETTKEVTGARTTVKGEVCETLDERIVRDHGDILSTIENITYIEGQETLDRTLAGELRDVVVEGDAYQNLIRSSQKIILTTTTCKSTLMVKEGTLYTFTCNITKNTKTQNSYLAQTALCNKPMDIPAGFTGRLTYTGTIATVPSDNVILTGVRDNSADTELIIEDFLILEGDFTNKTIPPHLEGIESVCEREKQGDKYPLSVKVTGKNLDNGKVITQNKGRINENNGSVYADSSLKPSVYVSDYIGVKPNTTYVYTKHTSLGNDDTAKVQSYAQYDENKKFIKGHYNTNIITVSNCKYVRVTRDTNINFQLEEGTASTPYEPYKEQSKTILLNEPLRSIPGGVSDEVHLDKGYVNRRIAKVVLNGTETWSNANVQSETIYWVNDTIKTKKNINQMIPIMYCDKIPVVSAKELIDNQIPGISTRRTTNQGIMIRFKKDIVSNLKEWLATNPTTIYFELPEPIQEPIQKVLLKSYDGKTYISSNNYIKPVITAKALTNVSAMINDIRSENTRLKNEVVEVENETVVLHKENIDTMAFSLDLDFRLMDVEWLIQDNTPNTRKKFTARGFDRMRTQYDMMKTLILAGEYEKNDMTNKVNTYFKRGVITLEQKEELLSLMEAREIIEVK